MLDKTSEKIDPSMSDQVEESSAKTNDPTTLPQSADTHDESDMGSDAAVSPMLQAIDQKYDESDMTSPVTEPISTEFPNDIATDGFPSDIAAESAVASTSSTSLEFPEDVATDSATKSNSWQSATLESSTAPNSPQVIPEETTTSIADAFFVPESSTAPNSPQVISSEETTSSVADAFFEHEENAQPAIPPSYDIAVESAVVSTSSASPEFPDDIAVASTSSTSLEFPEDVATDSTTESSSWQSATSESSTAPNSPQVISEETTSSIADAFFVHKESAQTVILPSSIAEVFFNKDKPNIADAIFDQNPPRQSEPSQPAASPPIMCSPAVVPEVMPVPSLLLQDVQSDADLKLLRVKYRERYIELEEMLEYAAATSKLDPLSLSLEVKKLKKIFFYESPSHLTVETLCEAEADMEELYATLSQLIYPVTIQTLRATSELYPIKHSWLSSWLLGSNSIGLNFFRQIIWVAIALIGLLCLKEGVSFYIADHATTASTIPGSAQATVASIPKNSLELLNRLLQMATPFLYGAIGSLVYIYKTLSDLYVCRTLDPNKLANDWMRLFMGGLMGGLTVALFYQQYYYQGYVSPDGGDASKISAVALAFLTGYSVEFFYRILDRIINTVLPKSVEDNTMAQAVISPRQQQMDMLLKRLKDAKSDEDKAIIRDLLGKL